MFRSKKKKEQKVDSMLSDLAISDEDDDQQQSGDEDVVTAQTTSSPQNKGAFTTKASEHRLVGSAKSFQSKDSSTSILQDDDSSMDDSSSDDDDDEIIEEMEFSDVDDSGPVDLTFGAKHVDEREAVRDPVEILREVPFFAQFKQEHQNALFKELETCKFSDGVNIVTQGELGDKFYVITEGEAVVSKEMENGEVIDLTHIYSADYFGEMVLIYGGKRIASVTSVGNTTCGFLAFVSPSSSRAHAHHTNRHGVEQKSVRQVR